MTHSLESGVQALLQSHDDLHNRSEDGDRHHVIGDLVSIAGGDQAQDVVLGLGVAGSAIGCAPTLRDGRLVATETVAQRAHGSRSRS